MQHSIHVDPFENKKYEIYVNLVSEEKVDRNIWKKKA